MPQTEPALTIGSPVRSCIGRYARLAQGAHLLGQVLQDISNSQESEQLRRTILALLYLSREEGRLKVGGYCTQMAICFRYGSIYYEKVLNMLIRSSAICILDNRSLPKDTSMSMQAPDSPLLQPAFDIISLAVERESDACNTSPFLLHLTYKVASIYLKGGEGMELRMPRIAQLKNALQLFNSRWLAAGKTNQPTPTFLSMLILCQRYLPITARQARSHADAGENLIDVWGHE